MDLLQQFYKKIKEKNIVEKFIYSFIIVFIVENLVHTFYHFNSKSNLNFFTEFFALSTNSTNFLHKILNLVTYSFLHGDFIHLIFNLLIFYYIANLFIDFFSERTLFIYFVLGSVFGGLFFLITNNYFNIIKNENAYLVGASASISAIIVGLATKMPNFEMNFRFIGYIKLWVLTSIWVILNIVMMHNGNEGGKFAHLGGAFIGFILTKYVYDKNIKTNFTFKRKEKTNLKAVYKKDGFGMSNHQKNNLKQRKIDALLDKISKSGFEVLTDDEKEFLDRANKN